MEIIKIPHGKIRLDVPVSLVKGAKSNKILGHSTLGKVFKAITHPDQAFKEFSKELRGYRQNDPRKYNRLKETDCPGFILGKYQKRTDRDCEIYVPLIGFDIDALTGQPLDIFLSDLKKCEYIFCAFPSPSGEGFRILVWADSTPQTHKAVYADVCAFLSEELHLPTDKDLRKQKGDLKTTHHIDTGTNNLSRLWFYSAVPEEFFYLNVNSQVFVPSAPVPGHQKTIRAKRPPNTLNGSKPLQTVSISEKIALCWENAYRKNNPDERNNFGFAVAREFYKHRVPRSEAYAECLKLSEPNHPTDPYTETHIKNSVESAYKNQPGQFDESQIAKFWKNRKAISNGSPIQKNNQVKEDFHKFYRIEKSKDGRISEIRVNYLELVRLLKELGFRRYDFNGHTFIIQIIDNVAKECDQKQVIDTFEEYLSKWSGQDEIPNSEGVSADLLINKIYKNLGTYFSDYILHRLRSKDEIHFLEDTQNESFFCYQNCIVKVTKDSIDRIPYSTMKGKTIWSNQILSRPFSPLESSELSDFCFTKFVSNISNNLFDTEKERFKDPHRFKSLQTIIGYSLHRYFEGKLKATIFTDSRISDDPSGRTGKTLLAKGLAKMLNVDRFAKTYVELNGKNFDFGDRFRYQECAIDTKLVHINDAIKNFDFELLFNDISEGIRAQRKNQTPFLVLSKMIISTNRTIRVHGDSAKDRAIEFELADHYNASFSPEQEFGQWFFRDWSEEDWNMFDNFMVNCVQLYLQHGVINPNSINLNERKLIEETVPEFVTFMNDFELKFDYEYSKKVLFEDFQGKFPDFQKLRQRTFTKWIRAFAEFNSQVAGIEEPRRNCIDYVKFLEID